jgi:hypothetical protein
MNNSLEHNVLFTIAEDGTVGMFPSAAAIEAQLSPSASETTRAFTEDAGELDLQVEVELFQQPIDGLNIGRPRNITTVIKPDEVVHDPDFLKANLVARFPDFGVTTASDLTDIVAAVKSNLGFGFH